MIEGQQKLTNDSNDWWKRLDMWEETGTLALENKSNENQHDITLEVMATLLFQTRLSMPGLAGPQRACERKKKLATATVSWGSGTIDDTGIRDNKQTKQTMMMLFIPLKA